MNKTVGLEVLKKAGYKYTGKRKAIIDLFIKNQSGTFTASHIYNEVLPLYPKISPDTVYRTVNLLEELGIIERLEFKEQASSYRLRCQSSHHHHAVCTKCGRSTVLETCPVEMLQDQLGEFQIEAHKLEVYGTCKNCIGLQ
jgi:Fur family transcriptional regulator, zinc uptake regulator